MAVGQAVERRQDGEQDGSGATEADPADEGDLARREPEGQKAEPDRQRPGGEDQDRRQHQRRNDDLPELRRRCQQAEDQEHPDLGEPGHAELEAAQPRREADPAVAGDDAGGVGGDEAAAAQKRGCRDQDQRRGQRHDRIEAGFQVAKPVQQPSDGEAAEHAQHQPQPDLQAEAGGKLPAQAHAGGLRGDCQFGQKRGEEDRDRVVGAGLDLERRLDPLAEVDAAGAQQKEHRRGVGGGDDRGEQEAFDPADVEQQVGGGAEDQRRQQHAQRRQHHRRGAGGAEVPDARLEAAVEQDDRQRQRADEVGNRAAVELDAEQPVLAGEQAEGEEHQQQRRPGAPGGEAGQGTQRHQACCDQDRQVHRVEHAPAASLLPTAATPGAVVAALQHVAASGTCGLGYVDQPARWDPRSPPRVTRAGEGVQAATAP